MSLSDNNATLNTLLDVVNRLPKVRKYGKAVFFGDSISYGYGNAGETSTDNGNGECYSFVDVLEELGVFESVKNHSVSGTTIGPYGWEEGQGLCLTAQIETYAEDIQNADIIFLEYGANDTSAMLDSQVMAGFATDNSTDTTICGYARKALDRIKELNPNARVVWLAVMRWKGNVDTSWFTDYYRNMYNSMLYFEASLYRLLKTYDCSIIDMSDGYGYTRYLDEDNVHPNMLGHQYMAQNILENMFANNDTPHLYRQFNLTATTTDAEGVYTYSIDGQWLEAWAFLKAGGVDVSVRMIDPTTGITLILRPEFYSDSYLAFMGHGFLANALVHITVGWSSDGTISVSW